MTDCGFQRSALTLNISKIKICVVALILHDNMLMACFSCFSIVSKLLKQNEGLSLVSSSWYFTEDALKACYYFCQNQII